MELICVITKMPKKRAYEAIRHVDAEMGDSGEVKLRKIAEKVIKYHEDDHPTTPDDEKYTMEELKKLQKLDYT